MQGAWAPDAQSFWRGRRTHQIERRFYRFIGTRAGVCSLRRHYGSFLTLRQKLDLSRAFQMRQMRQEAGPFVSYFTPQGLHSGTNVQQRAIPPLCKDLGLAPPKPDLDAHVSEFLARLAASIKRRVENIPVAPPEYVCCGSFIHADLACSVARVAVLFSGGVDCSLLAGLIHR